MLNLISLKRKKEGYSLVVNEDIEGEIPRQVIIPSCHDTDYEMQPAPESLRKVFQAFIDAVVNFNELKSRWSEKAELMEISFKVDKEGNELISIAIDFAHEAYGTKRVQKVSRALVGHLSLEEEDINRLRLEADLYVEDCRNT